MATKNSQPEPVAAEANSKFNFNSLNTLAVVSLATALTSIGAVAAVITGHIALAQLKTEPKSGRGLALAGLIVGYATIAFWVIAGIGLTWLRLKYGFDGPMEIEDRMHGPMGQMGMDDDHGMRGR
ncbi:MAG: hypothetical protein RLZZ345_133 [Actinomycetota bacterium]|jgi:uncharacterized protein with PQ loop repeat